MIWIMKLCVFAQVVQCIQHREVYASNITWEPMQIPLVFGKVVGIRCSYHNILSCNAPTIWTWYTGADNELIMTNGTLSEEYRHQHKYSEITSSCLQASTLIVSNFNESDYNQTYKCGIAIIKQTGRSFAENIKDKITFENTSYEYVPSDEMISTEIQLLPNQIISFRAEIERVYPLPDCEATFNDEDITTDLKIQKKKKSIFYQLYISLTLKHTSVEYFRTICIKCKGRESWWYLTKSWNPYCTDKPTTNKSDFFLAVTASVYSSSYFLSSTVVLLVLFFSRNDMFETRMNNLIIFVDLFHCVWIVGIFYGYAETTSTDNKDRFRQHSQYEYVFNIITKIGLVKCIALSVVHIINMMTITKLRKKWCKNDSAEYVTYALLLVIHGCLVKLLVIEGKDGSQVTASAFYELYLVQIFIQVKSICCYVLRRCHNIEDTEDKVGDKKGERLAPLVEKERDAEPFGSSETQALLVEKEPFGSFGSYSSNNDGEMCIKETAV